MLTPLPACVSIILLIRYNIVTWYKYNNISFGVHIRGKILCCENGEDAHFFNFISNTSVTQSSDHSVQLTILFIISSRITTIIFFFDFLLSIYRCSTVKYCDIIMSKLPHNRDFRVINFHFASISLMASKQN